MVYTGVVKDVRSVLVLRLSEEQSAVLPARGMVMGEGQLNGVPFTAPLEPDGTFGHFLEIAPALAKEADIAAGQTAELKVSPAAHWPEPQLPEDIVEALTSQGLLGAWDSLTVKARWEWLRWIRSTNNPATRDKRIHVAVDKLMKGDRRPCCFNTASCTLPQVSKSGVLL